MNLGTPSFDKRFREAQTCPELLHLVLASRSLHASSTRKIPFSTSRCVCIDCCVQTLVKDKRRCPDFIKHLTADFGHVRDFPRSGSAMTCSSNGEDLPTILKILVCRLWGEFVQSGVVVEGIFLAVFRFLSSRSMWGVFCRSQPRPSIRPIHHRSCHARHGKNSAL